MSTVPDQQLVIISLCACVLAIVLFGAGYYVGRADGIDELIDALRRERFAHTIDAALASDRFGGEVPQESIDGDDDQEVGLGAAPDEDPGSPAHEKGLLFIARLAGFGKRSAADAYKKRVDKKGIASEVVQRGFGRRGWYQVVTGAAPYDDTVAIVERLKKEDHLGTVEIVAVQGHGEREEKDTYDK